MKKTFLGMSMALMLAGPAHAALFQVTKGTSCDGNFTSTVCDALVTAMQTEINKETPDVSGISTFAKGTADATEIASKGLGSDYSDDFSIFSIKATPISVGLKAKDISKPESAEGIAFQGAVNVGVNLDLLPIDKVGPIDLSKSDLFFTFGGIDRKSDSDGTNVNAKISMFGVMARYELYEPMDIVPGYLVQWGGVHVHVGFYKSSMKLSLDKNMDSSLGEFTNGAVTAKFNNAIGSFNVKSDVTSIPLEVSTYIRLAYVITLYTGLGLDYNMGKADVDIAASGSIVNKANTAQEVATFSTTGETSSSGKVTALGYRAFLGLQFNIPFVRVFAQVNKNLASDSMSAAVGAKILY